LLAVAEAAVQVEATHQTKAPLIGVAVVAAVLDITLAQEGEAVVRAARDQVHLAVQEVPVVKAIQAVRAAVKERQVAPVVQWAVLTHVQVAPAAGQVFTLSAIRL
jgi:hypothetical protein